MRIYLLIFVFFLISFFAFSQNSFSKYDSLRGSLSPLRSCYDVYFYDLHLNIDIEEKKIKGSNTIFYKAEENFSSLQIDLFRNLQIDSIICNDKKLRFERDSNATVVYYDAPQQKGSKNFIKVFYQGKPVKAVNAPWDGGFVWKKDSLGKPWIGVACEGKGASLWWPCKDHLSDEPDSMKLSFDIPSGLSCISNGNLISEKKISEKISSFTWFVSYPINSYNVTFNIADYAHFSDEYLREDNSGFMLDYYVLSYNLAKAKKHFTQVKTILKEYEKLFGEYPFPKDGYALVETTYWGMEHQGCIAYGNHYKNNMLAKLDYIIVHESGHEWWGNSLSVSDHGEMWVHEAFTTYGEALLAEQLYGYQTALNYLQMQKKMIKNKEPIVGPLGVNYNGWKGSDMYYKGAWMLHTLRNVIHQDSLWFEIIHGLAEEFKLSVISGKQVIDYINKKSGTDYAYFFDQYLKDTSIPVFEYSLRKQKGKTLLQYHWTNCHKNFSMPVSVEVSPGKSIWLSPGTIEKVVLLEEKNPEIHLPESLFYIGVKQIH